MAYSDFTLDQLRQKFGVENKRLPILQNCEPVAPSNFLIDSLNEVETLPIRSEKAKSEWIVVPILRELRSRNNNFFTIYSGDNLNADEANGLKGECDFILAKDIQSFDINYPIIQIVEAKKNDVELGVPQCAAQLIGAKIFNQKKDTNLNKIYGCVTTGNEWLFMVLEESEIKINTKVLFLNQIEQILGTFQCIIDFYKKVLDTE